MEKQSIAQETIEQRRLAKIDWLRSCCNQVIEAAERTLRKIDEEGLSGNYSVNHDIAKWSERVHRTSYELYLLADISKILAKSKKIKAKKNNTGKKK